MREQEESARELEFQGCRLEADTGDLVGPQGRTTRLAPQPTALLALLVVEEDRLVSRERIAERLWPHGSVEVDQGIGYAMREVRKALDSVGCDPGMIETIPRRGFRLRGAETLSDGMSQPETEPGTDAHPAAARSPFLWSVVLGLLGLAATVAVLRPSGPLPRVIVFEHEIADVGDTTSETAAFATALTTELTDNHADDLGVLGPTGSSSLTGPNDVETARERLGACLIVSGTTRPGADGGTVVFTQIVRTTDRVHVWARMDTLTGDGSMQAIVPSVVSGILESVGTC